ncbi:MAG: hypothetical protein M1840_000122 [Geoglossum simile]|nr:MAG: hypothetical protein M1840_000122 [Geoglossum simile]
MAHTLERRAIPGFVFDEARGRYFPVLPVHTAPPNYSFTEDAIRQKALGEKKRREEKERAASASLASLRNERYWNDPALGNLMLESGWGSETDYREIFTRQFAKNLRARQTFAIEKGYSSEQFCKDYETGLVIVAAHGPPGIGLWALPLGSTATKDNGDGEDDGDCEDCKEEVRLRGLVPLYLSTSEVTSINIGVTRTMISTSMGGEDSAAIVLSRLATKEAYVTDSLVLTFDCQVVLHPNDHQSIWTSAVSKVDGTAAAGTSNGVLIVKEAESQWDDTALELPSDVYALEFLGPDLLACGCRDSGLRLVDTRIPAVHRSSELSFTLRHISAITHVKQLNEYELVIGGLENSLCIYDIRWGHPSSPSKDFDKPSSPVREIKGHKNGFRFDLGFDIDVEYGLVAAATDDCHVQLFSLYSNRIITSPVSEKLFSSTVSCIQFARVNDGTSRAPSLLASSGQSISDFSW